MKRFLFFALLLVGGISGSPAATIHVPAEQATIAAAAAAAVAGDVIEVAPGTYTETATVDLQTSFVTLTSPGAVVLRGPGTVDAVLHVGSEVMGVTVNNFTIERTAADQNWMRCAQLDSNSSATFTNCLFRGPANGVGIILFNGADVTVTSSTFENFNASASWAGAITLEGNGGDFSSVVVTDSTFEAGCNRWITTVGTAPKIGELRLQRNTFKAALASQALYFQSDTAYASDKDLLIQDCSLQGSVLETAEFHYTANGGPRSLKFSRCVFPTYDSLRKILWLDLPTAISFENVVIAGGKHETLMAIWGGPNSVSFSHCTFVNDGVTGGESESGNSGSSFITGWDGGRTMTVRDCIFKSATNYTPGFWGDAGSSANRTYDIDYSIVNHATPGGDKVTLTTGGHYSTAAVDFTNEATRDYTLAAASPAVNAGTFLSGFWNRDAIRNPRKEGAAIDIGAYERPLADRMLAVPSVYPTLAAAIAEAGGGDTIEIAAGTYTEAAISAIDNSFFSIKGVGAVTLRAPASASSVIAVNPGVEGFKLENVTINRPTADNDWQRCVEQHGNAQAEYVGCTFGGPANGVGVSLFNGADGTFRNCTFGGFNPATTWAGAISLEYNDNGEYSNVVVENTTFAAGCNKWIAVTGSNLPRIGDVIVRGSTFAAATGSHALWFPGNIKYDTTREILFEDDTFNGTILEIGEFHYTNQGAPKSFTMRRCKVNAYDSLRRVFFLDLPSPMLFENLLIAGGKHETLLRFWGGPSSVTFQHCTLATDGVTGGESESGLDGAAIVDGWDGGRTFTLRNCLLYSPASSTGALAADASAAATRIYDVDYSIVQHAAPQGVNALILGGTHYSNAAIQFADAVGRDYHLTQTSPAVDAGTNLQIAFDLARAQRNQGAAPDLGAYESSFGSTPSAASHWTLY